MRVVHTFDNISKLIRDVADKIKKIVDEADEADEALHIALSGGSTPLSLFRLLGDEYRNSVEWSRVHLWWGDERIVPPSDDESNYKHVNKLFISKIDIPAQNIHRIKGELSANVACADLESNLQCDMPEKEGIPHFDIVLLGMGDDGHTASIFPDRLELLSCDELCMVAHHPISAQERVTLTGKVINHAQNVWFLVAGQNKKERVREIFTNDELAENLPAYHILPKDGELVWFLDNEAASEL
ncbi:MAG: 6-phosphogluconolactonase [Bacteroidales bacterium]